MTNETITKYQNLLDELLVCEVWMKVIFKELGRLSQGYGEVKSTGTIHFMSLEEISKIQKDRTVRYACIVAD